MMKLQTALQCAITKAAFAVLLVIFLGSANANCQTRIHVGTMDRYATLDNNSNIIISFDGDVVKVSEKGENYTFAEMPMTSNAKLTLDLTEKYLDADKDNKIILKKSSNPNLHYTTFYSPYSVVVPYDIEVYAPKFRDNHIIATSKERLPANTVVPPRTGLLIKTLEDATIDVRNDETDKNIVSALTGTVVSTPMYYFDPMGIYALGMLDGKIGFYHFVSTHTTPLKAFLLDEFKVSNSKSLTFVFDQDETTSIRDVEGSNSRNHDAYNIIGQRVSSNANGLIIKNGKKYINR